MFLGRSYTTTLLSCLTLLAFCCDNSNLRAEETATAEGQVSFYKQIVPILQANCYGCHQPAKALGEYDMTSFEMLLKGGATEIEAIVAGKPEESHLVELLVPEEGEIEAKMPKGKPALSTVEVNLIKSWITQGAKNDTPASSLVRFDSENPPIYSRPPVITSLDISPKGDLIAVAGFHEVLLVKPTGELVSRLIGMSERLNTVKFDAEGKRLLTTGGLPARLGEIQVWDIETQKLLLSKNVTHDTLFGGNWSPDGKLISFGCTDNTVRVIEAKTGKQVLFQGAHDDWVRDTVFSKEGSYLVSAGRDMSCKLTEVATERFVDNVTSITPGELKGGVGAVARHPERDEIVVGSADGIPKVYRMQRLTKRVIGDDANLIRRFPPMLGRIQAVAVSANGKRVVAGSALAGKGAVHVYSYEFDSALPDDIKAIHEKRVAGQSAEERKKLEEHITKDVKEIAAVSIAESGVYSVSFFPDAAQFAATGSDGIVRIYETETGKLVRQFSPTPLTETSKDAVEQQDLEFANRADNPISPEKLLKLTELTAISVEPKNIQLNNVHEYAQILVSGTLPSGDVVDVTRQVVAKLETGIASYKSSGLVQPLADGKTTLNLSVANQSVDIPVEITGLSTPYQADFIRDVNPTLTKLGCNSGTCHGADKGKNGFKLSLRGYDPESDVRAFTDDLASRRTNIASADNSLMLLKASGIAPHVGGQVMKPSSHSYHILRTWISSGAQLDMEIPRVAAIQILPFNPVIQKIGTQQQFRVVATYTNGATRDVTREAFLESGNTEIATTDPMGLASSVRRGEAPILARYEGAYAATTLTVMGDRSGFEWKEPESFNQIDKLVAAKWQRMKIKSAPLTNDAEFLRRIHLDLTGLPPTADQVRTFLADNRPVQEKRDALIESLVGSEGYVDHWTNKWGDMLQVNRKFLGAEGSKAFRDWIHKQVKNNTPYDEMARSIITASGSNKSNPASSYFKILRNPEDTMENTTHLFLAVRFNCNKCHDHPFERWTQDQYFETAAYFSQVNLAKDPESGDRRIGGTAVEGAKPLFEVVSDNMQGAMKHGRTGKVVEAKFPYDCDYTAPENSTHRQELAAWITSADNQYFAKSYVNRLWGYLLGTGIIEPIDDIRAGNPASNPELLDYLTQQFVESKFNVQHVVKLITKSRTYQLSIETNKWNEDDVLNYSHAQVRRLPAEVLFDAIHAVTGSKSNLPGVEPGIRAAQLIDVGIKSPDGFLNTFGRPSRESSCECERSNEVQLGPIMAMIGGPTVGNAIGNAENAITKLVATEPNDARMVNELFLRVLNRPASVDEVASVIDTFQDMETDHTVLQTILSEREARWLKAKPELETKRAAEIAKAKADLAAYQKETAPQIAEQEKAKTVKVAEAEAALKAYEAKIPKLLEEWEAKQSSQVEWFLLEASDLKASNGATLNRLRDRSIEASGKKGKGVYTLNFKTKLSGITGIRLEALTQGNGLLGEGPGLTPHGNFVVTELETFVAPLGKPTELAKVELANAKADYTQAGFSPDKLIDNKKTDQSGWAVTPFGKVNHWATLEAKTPFGTTEGSLIQIRIHQFHNAVDHRLRRFRISFTKDTAPIGVSLSEEVKALVSVPKEKRTDEQKKNLTSYFSKSLPELNKHRTAVNTAKMPLPEDSGVTKRKQLLEIVSKPVALDPKLNQLRSDFKQSEAQQKNKRLAVAQDLTWALINNPAFLFNR